MGFRFRRSIRLGKGLRVNLSKSGASLSVGGRGATVNFGRRGTRGTVGIPGSGVSYSTRLGGRGRRRGGAGSAVFGLFMFAVLVMMLWHWLFG